MANRTISFGSSGDDVKKLQQALNSAGYSLEVDGKFGSKTQSAVRSYQQKNGLAVDGIVGVNTWNSLSKLSTGNSNQSSNKSQTANTNSASKIKEPTTKKRPTYEKNENVISAENSLSDWENNKPQEYESKYSQEIEAILDGILNREKFQYNMNADPLYNQYREQYINNGKKAMMDAVANASALSGGYSNSYAVTAGNEAYNEQLNKLNNIALNLYDRAYAKYKDDGDSLVDKITVLRGLDGDDYNKYRDELSDYYKDGDYLLNKLTSLSDADYKAFLEEVEAYENDRDYEYKKYLEALEQQNYYDKLKFEQEKFNEEMAFKKAEAERDQRNADRSYALSASKASSSSSSSKKSSDNYVKSTVLPKTYEHFVNMTGYTGILTKNEFNQRKYVKEEYGNYDNYLLEMYYKYGFK
ncbi:MAG: peptidoglycan-binding protein [Ruminococcaceae bacterium]|nr:peptidoglycan-binding protein [Oscillospiraceae bacterium]